MFLRARQDATPGPLESRVQNTLPQNILITLINTTSSNAHPHPLNPQHHARIQHPSGPRPTYRATSLQAFDQDNWQSLSSARTLHADHFESLASKCPLCRCCNWSRCADSKGAGRALSIVDRWRRSRSSAKAASAMPISGIGDTLHYRAGSICVVQVLAELCVLCECCASWVRGGWVGDRDLGEFDSGWGSLLRLVIPEVVLGIACVAVLSTEIPL